MGNYGDKSLQNNEQAQEAVKALQGDNFCMKNVLINGGYDENNGEIRQLVY